MPKKVVSEDWVDGTSEGLRLLIAVGADDRLLDRFMRAKVGGDEATAEMILSHAALLPAATAQAMHDDPLQSVRVAALRPYVNSVDPTSLQQYMKCMLDVSNAVVVGLEGRALWGIPGVVDAVAEVVRDASVSHLRRCSAWSVSTGAAIAPSRDVPEGAYGGEGLLDEAQFAARLGWTVAQIDRALASNSIFAVPIQGVRHFPPFLADLSYSRRHLSAVCRLLGGLSGPSKLQFFATPKASLGGVTPLEALRRRRFAAVCVAARGFVER